MNDKDLIHDYDGRPIVTYDIVPKIAHLMQQGYYLTADGKIAPQIRGKHMDAPWIYTRINPELNCNYWTTILFQTLGVFPPACLDCWKVVVRPKTVKQLIALYDMQQFKTERFCKCGIELRPFVNANYGGYFYNRSKQEGLECLDDVTSLVHKHVGDDVDVFLKRYCTEFELKFGPSDVVEQSLTDGYFIDPEKGPVTVMTRSEMNIWINIAEQIFDTSHDPSHQPPFVRQHIISNWFNFAWDRNDMTVKEFFGGEPLFRPSVRHAG